MSESSIVLPALGVLENNLLWLVFASALVALLYGVYLARKVLREPPGSPKMIEVSAAIRQGSDAYLARQFKVMGIFIIILAVVLYMMYMRVYPDNSILALGIAVAFLLGSIASAGAGYVGMSLAVRANTRVANAALTSYKKALEIAFQAGTVSGMFTVGFGLLGATIIFMIFKQDAMKVLIGFGFGGSLVALFMRIGGGIFTKAADVGADLVGKVEKDIPEDDPRNAAVIADNVGDNVGDCAGMAADVFESYEVTLVAAIILGAGALLDQGFITLYGGLAAASAFALKLIIFPLLVRAVGVFASIIGTMCVRGKDTAEIGDPMKPINFGFYVSAVTATIGFGLINYFYLKDPATGNPDWRFFFATLSGIILAIVIEWITNYFTHTEKRPVLETAYATKTGPATALLSGFGLAKESSVWAILAIAGTIFASVTIFGGNVALSAYGVALAGLGLLTTTGFILAEDTYGPISDNANGIFEMSGANKGAGKRAQEIITKLDAVGNTTKALTKGFAIATAVIAAIALFRSFIVEGGLSSVGIQINTPEVFIGLLIGGAVPFLFSSLLINAVGRTAFFVVEEVRRQFREIPGIMEGKNKPEYDKCVDIVTIAAQKELIGPALIGIFTPIAVGFGLGAAALGGYLAGSILVGQLLAVLLSNSGAIWDNAKKVIEMGAHGGKGSSAHKAAVIGDTVGDPFKDTAGPALNPLIKVMNLVAILILPLLLQNYPLRVRAVIVGISVALIIFAIWLSKKEGIMAEEG
ncbi:pyrophosphatase [candidate division WOR-1 bacterium RIFCSPHIGHO2_01_FULL_53_15]|uniref:K(+)-insensitive pyrophosphate-energized proton pump n=1 Tax=candidate division WOR-1 bacterium RIFCSPHIGHO2_01_FULL_53_15 TaxID=1802564 RepID=A0A1F4Q2W6_UNCSA|nr:MAG: pyrophosphatase [candidate division WOR-1 bacterium RIFCSPHIGHO2_01_FULL_53_15]OGC10386.1 MAG: pyrophosphatase [candidate division WOR-1 bacterium RIFCSPHIGHO2_02_FULL_53_26]